MFVIPRRNRGASVTPASIEAQHDGSRATSIPHDGALSAKLLGDIAGHQPHYGEDVVVEADGVDTATVIPAASVAGELPVDMSGLAVIGSTVSLRLKLGTLASQYVTLHPAPQPVAEPTLVSEIGPRTTTASQGGIISIASDEHFAGEAIDFTATGLLYLGKGSDLYPQDSTVADHLYFDASQAVTESITVTATNEGGSVSSTFTLTVNAVASYAWPASTLAAYVNRPGSVSGTTWLDDSGNDNHATISGGATMSADANGVRCLQTDGVDDYVTLPEGIFTGALDTATGTQAGRFNLAVAFDMPKDNDLDTILGTSVGHSGPLFQDGSSTAQGGFVGLSDSVELFTVTADGGLSNSLTVVNNSTPRSTVNGRLSTYPGYLTVIFRGLKAETLAGVDKWLARFQGYYSDNHIAAMVAWSSTAGFTAQTPDEIEHLKMLYYASRGELIDASDTSAGFQIAPIWQVKPTIRSTAQVLKPGTTLSVFGGEATIAKAGDPTPEVTYQWTRDGVAIEGATEPEYLLTEDDVGTDLALESIATSENGTRKVTTTLAESRTYAVVNSASDAASTFREDFLTRDFLTRYGTQVGTSFSADLVTDPHHAPFNGFGALRLTSTQLDESGTRPGVAFLYQCRPSTSYTVKLQKAGGTPGVLWKADIGTTDNATVNAALSESAGGDTDVMEVTFTTLAGQNELRILLVSPSYGVGNGYWDWESIVIINNSASADEIDRVAPNPVEGQGGIIPVPETPGIFYVDGEAGTDAGQDGTDKTNPWKTAPVAVPPGSSVVFKGGVRYRGKIAPQISGQPGNPVTWDMTGIDPATGTAWGTGPAILDLGEVIDGFGAGYALPNGATAYSTPAPTGFDPKSASIYDNDERMFLAQYPMAEDPYYQENRVNWLIPTANTETEFTHPDLGTLNAVEPLTDNAYLMIHHSNNSVGKFNIASFDAATNTVTLSNPIKTNSSGIYKFSVMNHPSGMNRGGTFMTSGGDLVIRPFDDAPMAGRLVTTQGQGPGFDFGSLSHHTLKKGIFRKIRGGGVLGEGCSYIRVEETECYDINHSWGCINFDAADNVLVKDVRVENMLSLHTGDKPSACSMRRSRDSLVIGGYFRECPELCVSGPAHAVWDTQASKRSPNIMAN